MIERQHTETLGDLMGIHDIGAVVDAIPQPAQSLEELPCVAGPFGQLDRLAVGRFDFRRRIAVQGDARNPHHRERTKLEGSPLGTLRQGCDQAQRAFEVLMASWLA